jgi:GLPGLI family protein
MIKLYLAILMICLKGLSLQAQYAYFGSRGTIDFDKVIYTKAKIREMSNDKNSGMRGGIMLMEHMEHISESQTEKLHLYFDEISTVLLQDDNTGEEKQKAGGKINTQRKNPANRGRQSGLFGRGTSRNSKVLYQDLKSGTADIQLEIDEKYLLSETLDSITWRFTEEFRPIAGINCRRVNGATKDSLYLIAYYTEEIPVSAGPALTHGLPGMILGLVIPEMHIQYWATHVAYTNDPVPSDWRDKKSKKMKFNEFIDLFGRYMPRSRQNESAKKRILEQLVY